MRRATGQRGVALITALLIVALATALAAAAMWDFNLDRRRTESLLFSDQAAMFAMGAESWAGRILSDDLADGPVDHPGEIWATDIPPLPVEGGSVDGALVDLDGRFNVNNLVDVNGATDPEALRQFQRLLEVLEVDPRLAAMTADWIDRDIEPNFPDGAEDPVYLGQVPPHRAPNMPVTTTSELVALPEMDRDSYARLEPHIAALPAGNVLNINTATAPVLASLAEGMSLADAVRMVETRPPDGYASVGEAASALPAGITVPMGVSSRYFRLLVRVNIGTVDFTMYSLLDRQGAGAINTLLRTYGAY